MNADTDHVPRAGAATRTPSGIRTASVRTTANRRGNRVERRGPSGQNQSLSRTCRIASRRVSAGRRER